jgi:hypothetical protein
VYDEDEHIKEVYARFGLALYCAQVLEHWLVNALVMMDLIPNRRHQARAEEEWANEVDPFMDRQIEEPMGRLIKKLARLTKVPLGLENVLRRALKQRNWLAHHYFRVRAWDFTNEKGRASMMKRLMRLVISSRVQISSSQVLSIQSARLMV